MCDNLLVNSGFEADWGEEESHRVLMIEKGVSIIDTEVGNIFTPPGWISWSRIGDGFSLVEVTDAHKSHDSVRVNTGNKAIHIFKSFGRIDAGLIARIKVVPGNVYRLTGKGHNWSMHSEFKDSHPDCYHNAHCSAGVGEGPFFSPEVEPDNGDHWHDAASNMWMAMGIDPQGRLDPYAQGVMWGQKCYSYNGYHDISSLEITAEGEYITVILRTKSRWEYKNTDTYWDDIALELIDGQGPTDPPLDPTASGVSKCGLHVLRISDGFDSFIQACPAVVKFVGDWGSATQLQEGTLAIGAKAGNYDAQKQYNAGLTPKQAAQQFVDDMRATYEANPSIEYWEGHNEPVWTNHTEMGWYAQFEIERMKLMANMGLKCVIGNFATGTPPLDLWSSFVTACQIGKNYNSILGLHEYSCPWMWWMTGKYQIDPNEDQGDEGWTTLRYRKVYRQYLEPANAVIPLVITETGIDGMVNPKPEGAPSGAWSQMGDYWAEHDNEPDKADYYFRQLVWYDKELQKDDYVIGATIFTCGNWGEPWDAFDIAGTPVIQKLTQYIEESHQYDPPDPTDPPQGGCRGGPRIPYERTCVLLPPDADAKWAHAVVDGSWDTYRYTLTNSGDDAGIGDLDVRKIIAVNPDNWPGQMTLAEFYAQYYPGVQLFHLYANTPQELRDKLLGGDIEDTIFLSMLDPSWRDYRYKNGGCFTIGEQGCWLTCSAMALRYYGIDPNATPITVDQAVGVAGYFACEMTWEAMNDVGLQVVKSTTNIVEVLEHLASGEVCFAEAQPGVDKHFVMVTKYSENRFWCYDPLHTKPCWLDERYQQVESWRLIKQYSSIPSIPYLKGLHDEPGGQYMLNNEYTGICLTHALVKTTPVNLDFRHLQNAGITVVCRLGYGYADGTGTMPPPGNNNSIINAHTSALIDTMTQAKGVDYWQLWNEVNNISEWPNGYDLTPKYVVDNYNVVWNGVLSTVKLGPPPIDPYYGPGSNNREWWIYILDNIDGADALYLHAKTQTNNPNDVFSEEKFQDDPLRWQYLHMRVIETSVEVIPPRLQDIPVFVTEANPSYLTTIGGDKGWVAGNVELVSNIKALLKHELPVVSGLILYRYEKAGDQAMYGLDGDNAILEEIFS